MRAGGVEAGRGRLSRGPMSNLEKVVTAPPFLHSLPYPSFPLPPLLINNDREMTQENGHTQNGNANGAVNGLEAKLCEFDVTR